MNKTSSINNGTLAEEMAKNYLQQQGCKLIKKNFYSRFGEIDLIMQDQEETVFIEVRYRKTSTDEALTSINNSKQTKLIRTAQYYIMKCGKEISCRFDVVAIDGKQNIKWLKNAITVKA